MKSDIITEEELATQYLDSLEEFSLALTWEALQIQKNENIIEVANDLIKERLSNDIWALKLTDIVSAKDNAFKQLRVLQWKDTESLQLIPTQINIQIINNK